MKSLLAENKIFSLGLATICVVVGVFMAVSLIKILPNAIYTDLNALGLT
jgi:hypothetical protein